MPCLYPQNDAAGNIKGNSSVAGAGDFVRGICEEQASGYTVGFLVLETSIYLAAFPWRILRTPSAHSFVS